MTQRAHCSTPGCDKPAKFLFDRPPLHVMPEDPIEVTYTCDDHVADRILTRNQTEVPA